MVITGCQEAEQQTEGGQSPQQTREEDNTNSPRRRTAGGEAAQEQDARPKHIGHGIVGEFIYILEDIMTGRMDINSIIHRFGSSWPQLPKGINFQLVICLLPQGLTSFSLLL